MSILSSISFLVFFTKGQSNYHFPRDSKTDEHSFDLRPKFLYVLSNINWMVKTKENWQFFASSYKINEEQSNEDILVIGMQDWYLHFSLVSFLKGQ